MAGRQGPPSRSKRGRIIQAKAHGEAWRRVTAGEPVSTIIDEIRALAGDHRSSLVEIAGIGVGVWSAKPSLPATEILVAGILLEAAGAKNLDELTEWIEVGRERGSRPPHTAPRTR